VGDGVAAGCCALDDQQLKQIAAMIAGITNHLNAKPIRLQNSLNECHEWHRQPSPLLTLEGELMIIAADPIQNLQLSSSWIIFSDYDSRIQIGSATDHGLRLRLTGAERRDAVANRFGVVLSMSH